MTDKLITIKRAAEILGLNQGTVRYYINKGLFPCKRSGIYKKVPLEVVNDWMATHSQFIEGHTTLEQLESELKEKIKTTKAIIDKYDRFINREGGRINQTLMALYLKVYDTFRDDLPQNEREVLDLIKDTDTWVESYLDIAEKRNITKERARQIVASSYKRLKNTIGDSVAKLRIENQMLKDEIAYLKGNAPDLCSNIKREFAQVLSNKVCNLNLPVRTLNALRILGVRNVMDMCKLTPKKILSTRNAGRVTLNHINDFLASHNLRLGMEEEDFMDYFKVKNLPLNIFLNIKEPSNDFENLDNVSWSRERHNPTDISYRLVSTCKK